MRLRKKHGIIEKLNEFDELVIIQSEPKIIEFSEIFGNDRKIMVEFGIGKGKFISELAKQNPDINYIGVEQSDQILLKAVKKAKENGLTNVRFLLANVFNVDKIFNENSVERIYLNFSDPWPKKKHYKRRMTYREFVAKYDLILKEDGVVIFKTDNESLFQYTLSELEELSLPMENITFDLHNDKNFSNNIMTEYEEKFTKLGSKIMSVTFKTHK